MSRRLGLVAVGALAVGLTLLVLPGLTAALFAPIAASVAAGTLATAVVPLALCLLAIGGVGVVRRESPAQPTPLVDEPPESGVGESVDSPAKQLRRTVTRATANRYRNWDGTDEATVERELREAAIAAERRATGTRRAAASDAVDSGEWTDDPVAAAFLADEDGPEYDVIEQLSGRLNPGGAYRRRVDRTAAAIVDRHPELDRGDAP